MFAEPLNLSKPGLFVTATDTGVGKTVVSCAIAATLGRGEPGLRVGVFKPVASECAMRAGRLVNGDALALQRWSGSDLDLEVINPLRYEAPVAPGVAAAERDESPDFGMISAAAARIDEESDCVLVEGAGGLLVPLDFRSSPTTILDLVVEMGYPVLVVARAVLGTLNHTALSVMALRERGCRVAGVVVNGMDGELAKDDPSVLTNCRWIEKMTGLPVLATLPRCEPGEVQPAEGKLPQAILDAVRSVHWRSLMHAPAVPKRKGC